jgi:hypothetical protein
LESGEDDIKYTKTFSCSIFANMTSESDNDPLHGLFLLLQSINNGADIGTGITTIKKQAINLLGANLPQALIDYAIGRQNNLLGGYPTHKDIAPSIVFCVVFFILGLLHFVIWIINFKRGHYFWLSIVWVFYCLMRIVGFGLRAYWGTDILQVNAGIASEVFLIIPSMVIVSFNLILAQRLFTWRHPVGGNRKLFWNIMFALYGIVCLVIAMTIVAAAVPYLYFLSYETYRQYKQVVMVSSVLIVLYSLTSISLIALSYFFKPTRKDENLYTYQPWWIESFHPFYFVQPHAAQKAEETFMKRNHNHRHAKRVIAATHHHYKMVEGLSNQRGELGHNTSLMILCVTTLLIFVGAIIRSISNFQARINAEATKVCEPVAIYIVWGLFETIVNLLYIIGRVDLRFYRPDILPAKVRAIITAEQSYYPSDNEEDMESTTSFSDPKEYDYTQSAPQYHHDDQKLEKFELFNDNESEFNF